MLLELAGIHFSVSRFPWVSMGLHQSAAIPRKILLVGVHGDETKGCTHTMGVHVYTCTGTRNGRHVYRDVLIYVYRDVLICLDVVCVPPGMHGTSMQSSKCTSAMVMRYTSTRVSVHVYSRVVYVLENKFLRVHLCHNVCSTHSLVRTVFPSVGGQTTNKNI